MSLRFRRSVKLAPGVRMNFSGSGASWTLGPRGASVGVGKRGAFLNTSFFGTGLSSRERIGAGTRSAPPSAPPSTAAQPTPGKVVISAVVRLLEDGNVAFVDTEGRPLSAEWERLAKAQSADVIRESLLRACEQTNADIDAILNLHHETPPPAVRLHYELPQFTEPAPTMPPLLTPRWWLGWFAPHVRTVTARNDAAQNDYQRLLAEWTQQKHDFDEGHRRRKRFVEIEIAAAAAARETWLEEQLASIVWPRETVINYQLSEDGTALVLDVDLPEIEDMPSRTARPAERGFKVVYKPFGQRALEHNYARHVHGLLVRLTGEMYAALPMLESVTVSGYTQRHDPVTGHRGDDYVLSLFAPRDRWWRLNFDEMAKTDPVESFKLFDHRRDMTASCKLRTIEPLAHLDA